ncbi:hypothetical protein BCR34DRAFT_344926 [Clohesyomyces aquaticus]|uniref:Uncharacterized protein n=1 Tax=Clohesyomyces aquaticus TaxID=1231657 RepID=A0A1Y1ZK59_9PLEO|nr:hypothetical protein BCR34DRAFT_344926 [Clohesyomyces aquaticus]
MVNTNFPIFPKSILHLQVTSFECFSRHIVFCVFLKVISSIACCDAGVPLGLVIIPFSTSCHATDRSQQYYSTMASAIMLKFFVGYVGGLSNQDALFFRGKVEVSTCRWDAGVARNLRSCIDRE